MMGLPANLLLIVFTVLFSTGWFRSKIPVGSKKLLILILLYLLVSMIDFPFFNGIRINMGGFVMPAVLYFYLWVRYDQNRVYTFTSAMLIGAIYFALKVFFRSDPILLVFEESFQISLILSVVVFVVAQNLMDGVSLFIGGTLIGELFFFSITRAIWVIILPLGIAMYKIF
ncbi:hypothetical protein [Tepidibacillus marianensis]|uniref:YphA family membrane protein n=1 Tax=Tepidibacillus marianensis TaxID=3131995 RepID=UPI0030D556D9